MYNITDYSYRQAKKLGVDIMPSTNKTKKIDIIKNGKKIASIGFLGMMDYPTHIIENGKQYANQRRKLYKLRHAKDIAKTGSNGWWADRILW